MVCGEALMDVIDGGATVPGGGPFNTARALARLGVSTAFLGRLSTDASGLRLKAVLEADGVTTELCTAGPEPTTEAVAHLDPAGGARYEFSAIGTSAPHLTTEMLPPRLDSAVRAIHVGSLGLVLEPMATTLAGLVEREAAGRAVMLDPNVRAGLAPDSEYRERLERVSGLSTIVKASAEDLAWMYPGLDGWAAAERLLAAGVRLAVVTYGRGGAYAAHGPHRVEVPSVPVEVVDTIGAGDAFGAAVIAWLQEHGELRPDLSVTGAELRGMLEFACLAAAITCTRAGADPPRRDELAKRETR